MTLKEIDSALEEGDSLKAIAQAYCDIANLKIKRIRGEVERNRRFFEEIFYVFGLVKTLAQKKNISIKKGQHTISLLLSSNHRFYGSINEAVIDFFVAFTQKMATDKLIIGKSAIDYFAAQNSPTVYFKAHQQISLQTVQLDNDMPNLQELQNLVDIVKDYQQVLVFHSKLQSLLKQTPQVLDLSSAKFKETTSSQIDFKFIFEPELPKILAFFDSQIITLLLEEAFLESELARTASRFIAMDQAETEANKFIKEYQTYKAYTRRNLENNTILENYASMMAVRKEDYA